MKRRWFAFRPVSPAPLLASVEAAVATAIERAVPNVEDLQVHAIDNPAFRDGAEVMRREILRVLRAEFTDCGCHPVFHELGVHAPVGNARSVTP